MTEWPRHTWGQWSLAWGCPPGTRPSMYQYQEHFYYKGNLLTFHHSALFFLFSSLLFLVSSLLQELFR